MTHLGETTNPAVCSGKILFVTPPYHCGIVEIAGRWVPLNLVYLAGAARQAGLVAEIYDAMTKDHGYPEIGERFRACNPAYVAVTAVTATINDAVKTLELAKRNNPATVTILGGVHPTFMSEDVLNSSADVDYIVCGEGEITLRDLLKTLEDGGDPVEVPGLAFRRGGVIVKTSHRPLMESINGLPAAWDLLDWQDYTYFLIPGSRLGAISTSRGCNHDSRNCVRQKFWEKTWRARDPLEIVGELEHLSSTWQVNVFLISDEHPTRDRERWETLLDLLIDRALPISLILETRISDIFRDRDILGKYRAAGVISVSIGVDELGQGVLGGAGNESRVEEIKLALDLIHEQGIVSEASFMLGFPDETDASVKKTLQLAQYCNPDNANFFAVTPWPYGDESADVEQFIRVRDYSKYNLVDPVIEPEKMSMLQMEVALADCYRKFYMGKMFDVMTMKDDFRRSFMMRATKLFMGSPFILNKLKVGILGKLKMKKAVES